MAGDCGSCTMCCRLFAIGELDKPVNRWCEHCKVGDKCLIYDARPQVCREFECLWLQSQAFPDPASRWPKHARPDRCKVMVWMPTHGDSYIAMVDPGKPTAWREGPVESVLCALSHVKPVMVKANNGRNWAIYEGKGREMIVYEQDTTTGVQSFIRWVDGPPPGMQDFDKPVIVTKEKKP